MEIILHCSDSTFGNAALITTWHIKRGFDNIGYHKVVLNGYITQYIYNSINDGRIETGRYYGIINNKFIVQEGAHTLGHNSNIGICLIGKGSYTSNQINSLITDIKQIIFESNYTITAIKQHSDYSKEKPFCAGLKPDFMKILNSFLLK